MIRIMNNYGAPKIMTTCEISSQLFSDIISGFEQFRHQASQGGRNNQEVAVTLSGPKDHDNAVDRDIHRFVV